MRARCSVKSPKRSHLIPASRIHGASRDGGWHVDLRPSQTHARSPWQVIPPLTFQDKWPSTVHTGLSVHSCFHFILCLGSHQRHVIFTFFQIELFSFLLLCCCHITGVRAPLKGQRFQVLRQVYLNRSSVTYFQVFELFGYPSPLFICHTQHSLCDLRINGSNKSHYSEEQ